MISHTKVVSFSTELPLKSSAIFQKQTPIIDARSAKNVASRTSDIYTKSVINFAISSEFHDRHITHEKHWHMSAVKHLTTSRSQSASWFESKVPSQTLQITDAAYEKTTVFHENGRSASMKEKTILYSSKMAFAPSLVISSTSTTVLKHIAQGTKHIRNIASTISANRKAKRYGSYQSIEIFSAHQSNQGTTDTVQELSSSAIDAGKTEVIATVPSSRIHQGSAPVTSDKLKTTRSKLDSSGKVTLKRGDQMPVNATYSSTLKISLTRASQNDTVDRTDSKATRRRTIDLWLYVGIPVVVCSLIMTFFAAKNCRSGKER